MKSRRKKQHMAAKDFQDLPHIYNCYLLFCTYKTIFIYKLIKN